MRNVNAATVRSLVPSALAASLALGGLVVAASSDPARAGTDFIERFTGSWKGEGRVLRNEDGSTRGVACRVENRQLENTSKTEGECRAMVIFRREVGSEITLQPDGTFTGVYHGADNGAAELVGSLRGDTLELRMTYEKPIYGDRDAIMKITNANDGTYSVAVYDDVDNEGEFEQVSLITFRKVD